MYILLFFQIGELEGDGSTNLTCTIKEEEGNLGHVFGQDLFSTTPAEVSEVERYLLEAPITLKENPFQWWASKRHLFPKVATVARRYLSIPVTSLATGRVSIATSNNGQNSNNSLSGKNFGAAASQMASRRAAIDADDLDTYLFLSHNWRFDTLI